MILYFERKLNEISPQKLFVLNEQKNGSHVEFSEYTSKSVGKELGIHIYGDNQGSYPFIKKS